jgi:transcription initiation factor TFIIIB Brf1 subunit/transcription initiation factor TFIIB
MATYKSYSNRAFSPVPSHLICDICGSADIVDTSEGYVCRECGIVLQIQKLQYNRPYMEERIQHARFQGPTQIGTRRERCVSPDSLRLQRLNRQNSIIPNHKAIFERAQAEIDKVFSQLNLSAHKTIKDMVFDKFKEIRPRLRKGIKYRNPEKLVSIIMYFCFKLRNVPVNTIDLIDASQITRKEFNDFCLQIRKYIPEYSERNRQDYILNRVFEVSEHFALGMDYFHLARKTLKKLWDGVKGTTDNALAGLVSSIALLCSHNKEVTVSSICTYLGIRMSTVQAQVKKKIFERSRVTGFISLVKSKDLLVKIMEKFGLIEPESTESRGPEVSDIVKIITGNAQQVSNAIDDAIHYYFAVLHEDYALIYIDLTVHEFCEPSTKFDSQQKNPFIDLLTYRYPLPTGPP